MPTEDQLITQEVDKNKISQTLIRIAEAWMIEAIVLLINARHGVPEHKDKGTPSLLYSRMASWSAAPPGAGAELSPPFFLDPETMSSMRKRRIAV